MRRLPRYTVGIIPSLFAGMSCHVPLCSGCSVTFYSLCKFLFAFQWPRYAWLHFSSSYGKVLCSYALVPSAGSGAMRLSPKWAQGFANHMKYHQHWQVEGVGYWTYAKVYTEIWLGQGGPTHRASCHPEAQSAANIWLCDPDFQTRGPELGTPMPTHI